MTKGFPKKWKLPGLGLKHHKIKIRTCLRCGEEFKTVDYFICVDCKNKDLDSTEFDSELFETYSISLSRTNS